MSDKAQNARNAFYGSDSQSDSYKEEIAAALAGAAALEREATPALPDEERYYQLVNENRRLEEENARLRLPSPAPDVSEAELAEWDEETTKRELRLIMALRAARKREDEAVELLCEMRRHVPTFCDDDASVAKQKMNAFLAARETAALNEGAKNG
jgi:hypothetical protein